MARIPRPRNRPSFDLRRKVLLNNFLKEQMAYIPAVRRSAIEIATDEVIEAESANYSQNTESQENVVDDNPMPVNVSSEEPVPGTSNQNDEKMEVCETPLKDKSEKSDKCLPKKEARKNFLAKKISKLLKFRSSRRKRVTPPSSPKAPPKKKRKKAKLDSLRDVFKGRFFEQPTSQVVMETCDNDSPSAPGTSNQNSSQELTSNHTSPSDQADSPDQAPPSTQSQSVQTDASWAQDDFNRMEETNRNLREENRLLTESLSCIMKDIDLKFQQSNPMPDINPYNTSDSSQVSQNLEKTIKVDDFSHVPPQVTVVRSKSLLNRPHGRRNPSRTRSMNSTGQQTRDRRPLPYMKSPILTAKTSMGKPFYEHRTTVAIIPRSQSLKHPKRSPVKSTARPILRRRLSMPERKPSENSRSVLRHRSMGGRDFSRRKYLRNTTVNTTGVRCNRSETERHSVPLQDLPADAFY